jgi:hypothetical protein
LSEFIFWLYLKVTGDNLDVYIKRNIISGMNKNKDIHLFASNIIFPRISKITMENTRPANLVIHLVLVC